MYSTIREYIESRAHDIGAQSIVRLSEQMGFARSYLSAIINGQFSPSAESCWQIAEFFGDDPNIILSLAGYIDLSDQDDPLISDIIHVVKGLSRRLKLDALRYVRFLKAQHATPEGEIAHGNFQPSLSQ